jgi:hypothetical protein
MTGFAQCNANLVKFSETFNKTDLKKTLSVGGMVLELKTEAWRSPALSLPHACLLGIGDRITIMIASPCPQTSNTRVQLHFRTSYPTPESTHRFCVMPIENNFKVPLFGASSDALRPSYTPLMLHEDPAAGQILTNTNHGWIRHAHNIA